METVMYDVDVHPHVYEELERSRQWYEERAVNLGTEFLDEVDNAVETVRKTPSIWPFHDKKRAIRRYTVQRFPYKLIYRVSDHVIQLIAVMHIRRHPDYWRERLGHWIGGHGVS